MADNGYRDLAQFIIDNVGGKENIISVVHCTTRLRFKLKDEAKANDDQLKANDRREVQWTISSGHRDPCW